MVMVMSDTVKSQAETPLGFFAQWHEDVYCVFGRDPQHIVCGKYC